MKTCENILFFLTKKWKSEWDQGHPLIISAAGSEEHELEYAMLQLRKKIEHGIRINVYNKTVLEIGCGHGGICVYAALNGSNNVIGIDLSDEALLTANKFKKAVELKTERKLDISFRKMTAEKLDFDDESIDIIIADNVFEHVSDLKIVLKECNRVLKKGGNIVVPNFPSIYSKFGPHVKYGIKIPWVHIFFREQTIINVMKEIAKTNATMFEFYPGLKNNSGTFKDIRRYSDLNYITNKKFKNIANDEGFSLVDFVVTRPKLGWILMKIFPVLTRTKLDDIISIGTFAILKK